MAVATLSWAALGGDPAPGDPGAFDGLARAFSTTAGNAGEAQSRLNAFAASVDDSIWRGEAADAFREKIAELPPRLAKLHDSYQAASEGMGGYARALGDLQSQARALLARAQGAREPGPPS
ncbi:MAG: WXG100 family type VII secretion target [Egibacteraceae bacterium]